MPIENSDLGKIAQNVIDELDNFQAHFTIPKHASGVLYSELRHRSDEPFVALVKVQESVGEGPWIDRTYLVCRGYTPGVEPLEVGALYADRNSKVGRIASIEPKDEITLVTPSGKEKTLRVVAKDIFLPRFNADLWDALNNRISIGWDEEFVSSLRDVISVEKVLIETPATAPPDILSNLDERRRAHLSRSTAAHEARLLRQREIVDSIALKDQPILDKSQDDFCRRPLKSQLILSGSPGTGKTTSIIKRIAMKSDSEHLMETDGLAVDAETRSNWLMFTPNDLLKIYLKEAMNKEGLAATDQYVTTWEKERTILGRDVLRFLRVGEKGIFTKTDRQILRDVSSTHVTDTARAFITYLDNQFRKDFDSAVNNLTSVNIDGSALDKDTASIVQRFRAFGLQCRTIRDNQVQENDSDEQFVSLAIIERLSKLNDTYKQLRSDIDDLISNVSDNWVAANPAIFEKIVQDVEVKVADGPLLPDPEGEGEDLDEVGDDDSVIARAPEDPVLIAHERILKAVRARAESIASNRQISKGESRFVWDVMRIGEIDESQLQMIGLLSLGVKPQIFRMINFNGYVRSIPRHYQRFRQTELSGDDKYKILDGSEEFIKVKRISLEEIDILIFAMLKAVSIITDRYSAVAHVESRRGIIGNVVDQYRTQIAVDEATDFSAMQLASIFYLSDPTYRSVVYSGDLMQRVTNSGLASWKELKQLVPTIEQFELTASYRQTPKLLGIAKKLYERVIDEKAPFDTKYHGNGMFPAPLKYHGTLDESLATWLASRIHEVYVINDSKLPSIAVFVPTEAEIDSTCILLQDALNDYSIDVEACPRGKVLGTGSSVRVFSISYIKGLEFEGVFYLDIDKVHTDQPNLVDKYLYVGLTRATTFMAVSYAKDFPESISFVQDDFEIGDWSSFL